MQQHRSKNFARRPSVPLIQTIGQKSAFSEHCHAAYQIKGNHEFSNMVAEVSHSDALPHPQPPPGPLGVRSKDQS